MALAATMLFGCAGSDTTMNNDTTAMDSDMTMSETQTMAGTATDETNYEYDVNVEADPSATFNDIFSASTDVPDYDMMFEDMDTEQYDILSLAKTNSDLSTFVKLVQHAGLVDDLQRLDAITIFAPTNAAFAKIPKDQLEKLLMPENKAVLSRILQAHVLPSEVSSLQLEDNSRIQMSEDSYIPVEVGINNTNIRIGGAEVVVRDIEASNGTLHVIDSVIMPSEDTVEDSPIGY